MKVCLFRTASSPGCIDYGLKYLAEQHKEELPEASKFIKESFHVDDGLQSYKTEGEAVS